MLQTIDVWPFFRNSKMTCAHLIETLALMLALLTKLLLQTECGTMDGWAARNREAKQADEKSEKSLALLFQLIFSIE